MKSMSVMPIPARKRTPLIPKSNMIKKSQKSVRTTPTTGLCCRMITCQVAAAAMAMTTVRTEENCCIRGTPTIEFCSCTKLLAYVTCTKLMSYVTCCTKLMSYVSSTKLLPYVTCCRKLIKNKLNCNVLFLQ